MQRASSVTNSGNAIPAGWLAADVGTPQMVPTEPYRIVLDPRVGRYVAVVGHIIPDRLDFNLLEKAVPISGQTASL
jgi:hypothetical protein